MPEMFAVITIGIGVQTIVNVVWLVMLNSINKRIERIENNIFNLK